MPEKEKQPAAIALNRKATHDYFIEERYEAGLALLGTEVKALREGQVNLQDSFARIEDGNVVLHQCHISPYSHGARENHDPLRPRRLLLNRDEINRLAGKVQLKGLTLVPLSLYFKRGRAKVELGLARGKQRGDKRETLRRKAAESLCQPAARRFGERPFSIAFRIAFVPQRMSIGSFAYSYS